MPWRELNQQFVNPYNFVELDRKCSRSSVCDEIDVDTVTGWIECTLTNKSLLFIPHSMNDDAFELRDPQGKKIKSYDFFSYTNIAKQNRNDHYAVPVITGSEIRGAIHSAYETITSSCMSAIDDEKRLYKRTSSPAPECGRLLYENGEWLLEPCYKAGINTRPGNKDRNGPFNKDIDKLKEGQMVYVKLGDKYGGRHYMFRVVTDLQQQYSGKFEKYYNPDAHRNNKVYRGYVHKGEPFGRRKHHEAIFIPLDEDYLELAQAEVERLRDNIMLYGDDTVNIAKKTGNHKGYKHMGKITKETPLLDFHGMPVYCTFHEDMCYLSPACISREVFANRVRNLIGDFAPCNDAQKLCSACNLFGMVSEEKSSTEKINARASRLRFTDAMVTEEKPPRDYYHQDVILDELASPKPSATEFYLFKKHNKHQMWNYDYAGQWKGPQFCVDPDYKAEIRGRKYYWHQELNNIEGIRPHKATIRHVKIRPLRPNNTFSFRIYFDRIQKNDLKKLLWVLRPTPEHYHKLGMGKPLGLGSICIDIDTVKIRKLCKTEDNIAYNIVSYTPADFSLQQQELYKSLGCSPKVLDQFLAITNWSEKPQNVSYPKAKDRRGESIYSWFVANKQIRASNANSPLIAKALPSIGGALGLPVYEQTQQRNRSNRGHNQRRR